MTRPAIPRAMAADVQAAMVARTGRPVSVTHAIRAALREWLEMAQHTFGTEG